MGIAGFDCEDTPDGVRFRIKARAGARDNGIGGFHDGALRVRVTTAPEKGKANKAIISALSKALSIPKNSFNIISGETDSCKTLVVKELNSSALSEKLKKYIDS